MHFLHNNWFVNQSSSRYNIRNKNNAFLMIKLASVLIGVSLSLTLSSWLGRWRQATQGQHLSRSFQRELRRRQLFIPLIPVKWWNKKHYLKIKVFGTFAPLPALILLVDMFYGWIIISATVLAARSRWLRWIWDETSPFSSSFQLFLAVFSWWAFWHRMQLTAIGLINTTLSLIWEPSGLIRS